VKVKKLPTNMLKPGMVLAYNIYTGDHRFLLIRKGTRLSQDLIDSLSRRGVKMVSIRDKAEESSESVPPEVILPPDAKRNKFVPFTYPASLENRIFLEYRGKMVLKIDDPEVIDTKKKAVKTVHHVLKKIAEEKKLDLESTKVTAGQLLSTVYRNRAAILNIAGMKKIDEYTFVHSVNVAAYTTIIGLELGIERKELEEICTGALLHDVGKMLVRENVLNKPGKLTPEEFEEMKLHTIMGYEILRENGIEEKMAIIAKGHHEKCDGSGYPQGLTEKELPLSVQMAAITDIYDALTSDRIYKKAIDSNNAMAMILTETGKHYNPKLVGVFQRAVGIYPVGSLVKLNNGYIARVLEQNEGIVRPIIQLLYDNEGRELFDQVVIDLMQNDALFIVKGIGNSGNG